MFAFRGEESIDNILYLPVSDECYELALLLVETKMVSGRLCPYLALAFCGEGAAAKFMCLLVREKKSLSIR